MHWLMIKKQTNLIVINLSNLQNINYNIILNYYPRIKHTAPSMTRKTRNSQNIRM